jgi:hypothetical protein
MKYFYERRCIQKTGFFKIFLKRRVWLEEVQIGSANCCLLLSPQCKLLAVPRSIDRTPLVQYAAIETTRHVSYTHVMQPVYRRFYRTWYMALPTLNRA